MPEKFGLSYDEINSILKESISGEKVIDATTVRDVITRAIIENNKKILKDIQHIISK
ncbi:hypothetical protein [Clostridium sp. DMHC 10]|uniref:hypothetical protein n=1 Tax=Clostridium sp. DMHC 10 TaxID=747377 RepID=UPI000B1AD35B|nr:hypothetical protein [Clostridium sp. DMHC 10]